MNNGLFSYGININFTGNYGAATKTLGNFFGNFNKQLGSISNGNMNKMNGLFNNLNGALSKATKLSDGLYRSLFNITSLLTGGALTYGISKAFSSLMNLGMEMEKQFATMMTILGGSGSTREQKEANSKKRAMESIQWARKKGLETPFSITEVNEALTQMTQSGFNKSKADRERVFQAIGDFAGARSLNFSEAMQMVVKAGYGNGEWLKDRTGISKATIRGNVMESQNLTNIEKKRGLELAAIIEKGTSGTKKFKEAWVEVLGLIYKGGMESRLKTLGGTMSNISDIGSNFFMDLIGYTQMEDTLMNKINKTASKFMAEMSRVQSFQYTYDNGKSKSIGIQELSNKLQSTEGKIIMDKLLNLRMLSDDEAKYLKLQTGLNAESLKQINYLSKIGSIATGLRKVLMILWSSVDKYVGGLTKRFTDWIDSFEAKVTDFRGFVAPLIVYFYLLWERVSSFFKGVKDGFMASFGFLVKVGLGVYNIMYKLFSLFTKDKASSIEAVGKAIGLLVGAFLGFKALSFMLSPFTKAMSMGNTVLGGLKGKKGGLFGNPFDALTDANAMPVRVVNWPAGFGVGSSGVPGLPSGGGKGVLGKIGGWGAAVSPYLANPYVLAGVTSAVVGYGAYKGVVEPAMIAQKYKSGYTVDYNKPANNYQASFELGTKNSVYTATNYDFDKAVTNKKRDELNRQINSVTGMDKINSILANPQTPSNVQSEPSVVIQNLTVQLPKDATVEDMNRLYKGIQRQYNKQGKFN